MSFENKGVATVGGVCTGAFLNDYGNEGGGPVDIMKELLAMQDVSYRDFQRKLIPDIDPDTIIGVRTPQLRALAKRLAGTEEAAAFLSSLPHDMFEENQLHAFLIAEEKAFDKSLALVEKFLPYVDNWATCDQLSPKALGKDLPRLHAHVDRWLDSGKTYTIRFGMNMLMRWFLGDAFETAQLERVAAIRSEAYYVRMGAAWYMATALTRQYDAAVCIIEERRLDSWTHNKAIRKAVESYRIPPERKAYLRTLKAK